LKSKLSLAETHPEVAKQWHPTKNGDLFSKEVTHGSEKKVWWKCDKGDNHEWRAIIAYRINGNKCPVCNCLATTHPDITREWHPTKNGKLTASNVTFGSAKKVWWKCDKGDDHEWLTAVSKRTCMGRNCPICSGQKVVLSNCLATINPDLAKQWHPTKNGDLSPYDFTPGTNKKIWWKCDKGDDHEWVTSISSRSNGHNCPVCSGNKTVLSNCLMTSNPKLAEQWHPIKNGELTPYSLVEDSNRKVWWKCDKGDDHEWLTAVITRSKGHNCPVCAGQKIVLSNCLMTLNPKLAEQWHSTKAIDLDINYAPAYYERGQLRMDLKMYKQGVEDFTKVKEIKG